MNRSKPSHQIRKGASPVPLYDAVSSPGYAPEARLPSGAEAVQKASNKRDDKDSPFCKGEQKGNFDRTLN